MKPCYSGFSMTISLFFSALMIFCLRILDVSIGTLRISMIIRGRRLLAGIFSFVESLVWLLAAAQVLSNLDSPLKFFAYAGGYAAGTMLGSTIEKWLSVGDVILRVVSPNNSPAVADMLRLKGFFVTVINGEGRDGDVRISFSVIPRKQVRQILNFIKEQNPKAFVTFEETTPVNLISLPAARVRK